MGPLLAVVASDFQAITLTQDGMTALVSLGSDRGPIMLALPLEALEALDAFATRAGQVVQRTANGGDAGAASAG